MRKHHKPYFLFVLLCLACSALAAPAYAQSSTIAAPTTAATTATATMPPMLDLVTKIGIIAGVIAAVLQGVKKFVPALGGWYAVAINLVLSLALSYAAAPSADPLFFISAIGTALAAAGIHSFLRPAAPNAPAAPSSPPITPASVTASEIPSGNAKP
jgi:hypothetical protein